MLKRIAGVMGVLLLGAGFALAQSTYGTLTGNVKDPSGGVVPNATVVVTHVETNISKTATTDSLGNFQIPNLLPGNYNVEVKATGFKPAVQRGVPLDPRAIVPVDFTLEVGTTQTSIEVTTRLPVITTETATVSEIENNKQIAQLPINYRGTSTSPLNIITTLPGVQTDAGGALGFASISVSGNHPAQNEVSVDGFSVVSPRYNTPLIEMFPSTESISEVKITSQLGNAEYGQVGDISFIAKGGTNGYHGSLFEYLQNDGLDAKPFYSGTKPRKRANTFGGSVGGPVRLPGYNGKDRTFFFFDWETNLFHSSQSVKNVVPTQSMINGDFSFLCASYDANGICTDPSGTQVVNPFTDQPYANNRIPSGLPPEQGGINPISLKVLNTFYPLPNGKCTAAGNYCIDAPNPITTKLFDVRIDQNLGKKQSLFGRFSWKRQTQTFPLGLLAGDLDAKLDPKAFVLSHNYSIRSNLLNEFRFGMNAQTTLYTFAKFPDGAKVIGDLGLQQLGPFPKGSAIPYFEFDGASGIDTVPGGREEALHEHKYQIADNLTWIRGRHTIKAGLDIRALRTSDYEAFIAADNFGDYYFSGRFTGFDFADFLVGLPDYTEIVNAGPNFDGHARAYGFFGQDSFKVTPKLTINYGLRYEYHPPFHDDSLQIAIFNRSTGAVIVPNDKSLALATTPFLQSVNACSLPAPTGPAPCTPVITAKQAGVPETLRFGDKKKILPRLSFAYQLSPKWVVRAGAGLYDETLLGTVFYSLTGIHTSDYRAFINDFVGTPAQPLIQFPNTKTTAGGAPVVPAGDAVFGTSNQIDLHDPYAEQWSFTVERNLGYQTGLRVSYTGMRSVGLIVSPDLNQVRPNTLGYDAVADTRPWLNWSVIKSRDNGGSAFYNGLETVVTHRFTTGLFFQSSYIWSKNLSDSEGDTPNGGFPAENGPRVNNRFDLHANWGNVPFTRRHRFLTTYVWELPFGRGKRFGSSVNRALDAAIGGWQVNGVFLFQTGPYMTPQYRGSNDPSGTNAPHRPGSQRPDRLPASDPSCADPAEGRAFGGSCFFYGWPGAIGRFGNSGVGILTASGTENWDFGAAKQFRLTERARLRFESTFTNFLNHRNPGPPIMRANSGRFGLVTDSQSVEGTGARTIQFALRIDF